jgi:hypothetical protein
MMATTTARIHNSHPMSYYRNLVKDLDYSEKLELMSMIIDSFKSASKQAQSNALQPYTMDEINAMIDESERDIAEGRVYDHEDLMREWEEELAREEQEELEMQMAEAL